jgi:putative transposase
MGTKKSRILPALGDSVRRRFEHWRRTRGIVSRIPEPLWAAAVEMGVTHVRRCHEHYHSRGDGHVYQGRFKSFPVAEDDYFLALCRYVEANPLRAGLVERAEQWQWSGLWRRAHDSGELRLSAWPIERPRNWVVWVNRGLNDKQIEGIRTCVQRDRPLGTEAWVRRTAVRLGLDFTLRGPGRPRRTSGNQWCPLFL